MLDTSVYRLPLLSSILVQLNYCLWKNAYGINVFKEITMSNTDCHPEKLLLDLERTNIIPHNERLATLSIPEQQILPWAW